MKTRTLIILAAVLLMLIGVKLLQTSSRNSELAGSGLETLTPELSLDMLGSFVITGPAGEDIVIERAGAAGDDWVVASHYSHRAKAANITRLVEQLSGLSGEFRSDGEDVLADYGLDDDGAVRLRLTGLAGEDICDILLGKALPGGQGCFLRREGELEAYAVNAGILGNLGVWGDEREPKMRSFLELQAIKLERDQIDRLDLGSDDKQLTLVKSFQTQEAPDGTPEGAEPSIDREAYDWLSGDDVLDKAKVDGVAGALASIYAQDVLDPAGDYGFNETGLRAVVTMAGGERKAIEFGREVEIGESKGVALRIMGDPSIYLVYTNLSDRVFKAREDLLPTVEDE